MAPASLVGLLVAVVDITAFGELWTLRQTEPWLFLPAAPWLFMGILSALAGAVLMLSQQQIKRLLAFSTLEDLGYLTVALTAGGALGLKAALLGAAVHSLAKALLFSSLIAPEAEGGPLSLSRGGLVKRYPLSAFGFLVGTLAMLGIPPTLGFAARWRIYLAAYGFGAWAIAALMLATGLAVLAYSRLLVRVWWGPGDADRTTGREAIPLAIVMVILALVILISGCWPDLLAVLAPAVGG
jgi:multicomponent Na+:H+ antiporter subunit D